METTRASEASPLSATRSCTHSADELITDATDRHQASEPARLLKRIGVLLIDQIEQ